MIKVWKNNNNAMSATGQYILGLSFPAFLQAFE
jgi:hypothetical protein